MKTLADLKRHIRRYHKKYNGGKYDLLGFVENQDLSPEVESLFTFYRNGMPCGYDWVNGNEKMKQFIKEVTE